MAREKLTKDYGQEATHRSRGDALEWLSWHLDGHPRSWDQEARNTERRGYDLYDDFEAPPIAGYEELEREGLVERQETVIVRNQERVRFTLTDAGRQALAEEARDVEA